MSAATPDSGDGHDALGIYRQFVNGLDELDQLGDTASPQAVQETDDEVDDFTDEVAALHEGGYGVAVICKAAEAEDNEFTVDGYVLPCDHEVSKVVAIFVDGSYCVLSTPEEPTARQDFLTSFMPGHGPFPLVIDHGDVSPLKQFLADASYDVKTLLRSDNPDQGEDAWVIVEATLRNARRLRDERIEASVRQKGRLALGLSGLLDQDVQDAKGLEQ